MTKRLLSAPDHSSRLRADSDGSAEAIRGRLADERDRREALTAQLAALVDAKPIDADALVAEVKERAKDLRGLRCRHPAQTRQVIRLVLGEGQRWVFDPETLRLTATGSYRKLMKSLSTYSHCLSSM